MHYAVTLATPCISTCYMISCPSYPWCTRGVHSRA